MNRRSGHESVLNLLVVDDHPYIRQGLRMVFQRERGIVVKHEAANATDAIRLLEMEKYDVVIMDINLPDQNGLEVIRQLRTSGNRVPVLVLSMHSEESLGGRAIQAGADGFLAKDSPPGQLVEALWQLASGGKYFSLGMMHRMLLHAPGDVAVERHEKLSDREYQVMCMLAKGLPLTAIATQLQISPNTISTYRTRIFDKLEVESNAALTRYALTHHLID
jgi:two-component system, NarL family, invasion response regulator UvrY